MGVGGAGIYKWDNGDVYNGECKDGNFNGKGTVNIGERYYYARRMGARADSVAGVVGELPASAPLRREADVEW